MATVPRKGYGTVTSAPSSPHQASPASPPPVGTTNTAGLLAVGSGSRGEPRSRKGSPKRHSSSRSKSSNGKEDSVGGRERDAHPSVGGSTTNSASVTPTVSSHSVTSGPHVPQSPSGKGIFPVSPFSVNRYPQHRLVWKVSAAGFVLPVVNPTEEFKPRPGKLVVIVKAARKLHNTNIIGKMSPFVEIRLGKDRKRTAVIKKGGTEPSWEESVEFNVDGTEDELRVRVMDKNILKDDVVGTANIPLEYLLTLNARPKKARPGDLDVREGDTAKYIRDLLIHDYDLAPEKREKIMAILEEEEENVHPSGWFDLGIGQRQQVYAGSLLLSFQFHPVPQGLIDLPPKELPKLPVVGHAEDDSFYGNRKHGRSRSLFNDSSLDHVRADLAHPSSPGSVAVGAPLESKSPKTRVKAVTIGHGASKAMAARINDYSGESGTPDSQNRPMVAGVVVSAGNSTGGSPTMTSRRKSEPVSGSPGSASLGSLPASLPPAKPPLRLFGGPLVNGILRSKSSVPVVLFVCVQYITNYSLDVEGLFRIGGKKENIEALKSAFEHGKSVNLEDPHETAGVMKAYLRELDDGLIPEAFMDRFQTVVGKNDFSAEERSKQFKELIAEIPLENRNVLNYLIHFLTQIAEHSAANKMGTSSCSKMFAPNLLRRANEKSQTPEQVMRDSDMNARVVEHLITNYNTIFPDGPPRPFQPQRQNSRRRIQTLMADKNSGSVGSRVRTVRNNLSDHHSGEERGESKSVDHQTPPHHHHHHHHHAGRATPPIQHAATFTSSTSPTPSPRPPTPSDSLPNTPGPVNGSSSGLFSPSSTPRKNSIGSLSSPGTPQNERDSH